MATDGAFSVDRPNWANTKSTDIEEIRENFEYIRRMWMQSGIVPIHGASLTYGYTGDNLTSITFGGTLAGSVTFTYTTGNLTSEAWSLYGKTITITHTYSSGKVQTTSVSIA